MSDIPTKTYPPESVQRMIDDHVGDITKKGDAMSENMNPDTRTLLTRDTIKHLAERCDLNRIIGPLSLVNADEWDYLLTFTHRAIDAAGVEQLMRERDEARANAERLRADAERYQWLRSSQTHKSVGCIEFGVWGALLNGPELDAAVDRGMLASANEGGRDE